MVFEQSRRQEFLFDGYIQPRGSADGNRLQTLFTDFDCRNNQNLKISYNLLLDS